MVAVVIVASGEAEAPLPIDEKEVPLPTKEVGLTTLSDTHLDSLYQGLPTLL